MSIRNASAPVPCTSNHGSIFGTALQVQDLWTQTLSLSPPKSGRIVDATYVLQPMEEEIGSLGDSPRSHHQLGDLESAVQTFSYTAAELAGCGYLFFERQKDAVVVSSGSKGHRRNREPVLPRIVNVDAVSWRPMITNAGEEGNSYALKHEGEHVASIEVSSATVVIVHSTYSQMALEAKLIDPATRLAFNRNHPQQLATLVDDVMLDDDLLYLPLSEVLLGRALDRIPLKVEFNDHPGAPEARRVWLQTREFLRSMQRDVVRGVQFHNRTEFERVGATELEDVHLDFLL